MSLHDLVVLNPNHLQLLVGDVLVRQLLLDVDVCEHWLKVHEVLLDLVHLAQQFLALVDHTLLLVDLYAQKRRVWVRNQRVQLELVVFQQEVDLLVDFQPHHLDVLLQRAYLSC